MFDFDTPRMLHILYYQKTVYNERGYDMCVMYCFAGFSFTFTTDAYVLGVQYQVSIDHENKTIGLLGNFNGDPDDDLLPRDAEEPLDPSASRREIHNLFGETCKTVLIHLV